VDSGVLQEPGLGGGWRRRQLEEDRGGEDTCGAKPRRVGLAQLVKFLVVELTHPCSNPIFDMCVAFMANYFLVGGDILIDSEPLLMIDFVNLKIKTAQSFRYAHKIMVCVCRVFIGVSARTCMSIYVCTMFFKKKVAPSYGCAVERAAMPGRHCLRTGEVAVAVGDG
jgi:hypothetical protein